MRPAESSASPQGSGRTARWGLGCLGLVAAAASPYLTILLLPALLWHRRRAGRGHAARHVRAIRRVVVWGPALVALVALGEGAMLIRLHTVLPSLGGARYAVAAVLAPGVWLTSLYAGPGLAVTVVRFGIAAGLASLALALLVRAARWDQPPDADAGAVPGR